MAGWVRCSQICLPLHIIRLGWAVAELWCGVLEKETPFWATFSRIASWQVSRLSIYVRGAALRESVKKLAGERTMKEWREEKIPPWTKKAIISFSYPMPSIQSFHLHSQWPEGMAREIRDPVGSLSSLLPEPRQMAVLFFFLTSFCFGKITWSLGASVYLELGWFHFVCCLES